MYIVIFVLSLLYLGWEVKRELPQIVECSNNMDGSRMCFAMILFILASLVLVCHIM